MTSFDISKHRFGQRCCQEIIIQAAGGKNIFLQGSGTGSLTI
jgi:hypothetical protein